MWSRFTFHRLRERRDEIPVLLRYFVEKYSAVYRRQVAPFDDATFKFLASYSWPGNIRELENLCKRYVIVGGATQIVRELSARAAERQILAPESAGGHCGSQSIRWAGVRPDLAA